MHLRLGRRWHSIGVAPLRILAVWWWRLSVAMILLVRIGRMIWNVVDLLLLSRTGILLVLLGGLTSGKSILLVLLIPTRTRLGVLILDILMRSSSGIILLKMSTIFDLGLLSLRSLDVLLELKKILKDLKLLFRRKTGKVLMIGTAAAVSIVHVAQELLEERLLFEKLRLV